MAVIDGSHRPRLFFLATGKFRLLIERSGRETVQPDVLTVQPESVTDLRPEEKEEPGCRRAPSREGRGRGRDT
jgi:hypothetical protein